MRDLLVRLACTTDSLLNRVRLEGFSVHSVVVESGMGSCLRAVADWMQGWQRNADAAENEAYEQRQNTSALTSSELVTEFSAHQVG